MSEASGRAVAGLTAAFARIAEAPVIAALAGDDGAMLVWHDDAEAVSGALNAPCIASDAADGLTCEPGWGRSWRIPLPGSCLVQLDYEWPAVAPLVVPATRGVRWDRDGRATVFARDDRDRAVIARQLFLTGDAPSPPTWDEPLAPTWTAQEHRAKVARIRDLIAAGDCYQVNLAVPFAGRLADAPHRDLAVATRLLTASPSPFAGFFRAPGRASVISHSPECLLAVRGDNLCSVPIKGTRRRLRGREPAVRAELLAASKDGAELAMIVDLVRNDLGRVAVPGTVRVTDDALAIDLAYVHHRAARIEARRRQLTGLAACIPAVFPAGSITGAPKIRTMAIINELESARRGAAYGTFGWIGSGGADLAVAIRTATVRGSRVAYHAGGGIIWDSDPTAEWDEVLAKASGLIDALEACG